MPTAPQKTLRQGGSSPVTQDKFWGREADLKLLAERAENRVHTLLAGQRRIGKTSLLQELLRRLRGDYIGMYVDLEKAASAEGAVAALAMEMLPYRSRFYQMFDKIFAFLRELAPGVKLKKGEASLEIDKSLTPGNWQRKGEQLFDLLAQMDKPVLLCFDEIPVFINRLLNAAAKANMRTQRAAVEPFLSWLRAMSIRHKENICIIYCGSIGFEPVLERVDCSATINTFTPYTVEPWDAATALECLRALARHAKVTYRDNADELLVRRLRCCIPHHVQLLFMELYEQCERRGAKSITPQDVDKALGALLHSGKGKAEFRHYVERLRLTFDEQSYALACRILQETAVDDHLPVGKLEELRREAALAEDDLKTLMQHLLGDGYLEAVENGWRFVSPLLRKWWKKEYRLRA